MKWLVVALLVASGAAWITAGYCGMLRQEKVREAREALQRNEHRDAGAMVRKPPLESQSIRLVYHEPVAGGW